MKTTVSDSDDISKKGKRPKKHTIMELPLSKLTSREPEIVSPPLVPIPAKAPTPSVSTESAKMDNAKLPQEFLNILNNNLLKTLSKEIAEQKKTSIRKISALKDLKTLETLVSEFLKSFIIIGYTLNGEKIVIGHVLTQQDNDALTEHLRQTFMRVMNNISFE